MRKPALVAVPLIIIGLIAFLSARQLSKSEAERNVYAGTIEAEESLVGSTVGGRVKETLAREGDSVRNGQPLVLFESDELDASLKAAMAARQQAADRLSDLQAGARAEEIDRAKAGVLQARSQYDKLRTGSRPEEIAAAKAAMEQARERLALLENGPRQEDIDRARAEYEAAKADRQLADQSLDRVERLNKEGAVSAQYADEARARAKTAAEREQAAKSGLDQLEAGFRQEDIAAARQSFNQARANYDLVRNGPRREDIAAAEQTVRQAEAALAELLAGARPYQIEQARSALRQAEAQVQQIKAKLRERAVFAPRSGQLQVLNVKVGDIVAPGQSVATVIDPRNLYVRVYVPEGEIGGLSVGDKLPVVTDSGIRATGIVEQIPAQAEFTPRNVQTKEERALQVYAVKIRLPNPDLRLRAGMSAEVRLNGEG